MGMREIYKEKNRKNAGHHPLKRCGVGEGNENRRRKEAGGENYEEQ